MLENSEGAASSPSAASVRSAPRLSASSASASYPRTALRTALTVRSLRNSSLPVTKITLPSGSAAESRVEEPATGTRLVVRGDEPLAADDRHRDVPGLVGPVDRHAVVPQRGD